MRSPDGKSIAVAQTVQAGGFGTANIDTSVFLVLTRYSNKAQHILGFACQGPVPHPYVLDNAANGGGTIGLKMRWIDSSHLEVTYTGEPNLYFQVVKLWGVEILLRRTSGAGGNPPKRATGSDR